MMRSTNAPEQRAIPSMSDATSRWLDVWGVPARLRRVRIEFSSRLTSSLGMSYPERGLIRLNISLLNEDACLFDAALCHELAHLVIFHRHGSSVSPHGREWQALMSAAGFEPKVRLGIAQHETGRTARRYHHICPVCHASRIASRPMPRWRCSQCVAQGLEGVLSIRDKK
ncbi:MAG: SprT-like domain-containing protein [Gammaproteobacteria bacterium]|nr:SprT-like domain-containing protein [Gammaproteobacteria bacterium]